MDCMPLRNWESAMCPPCVLVSDGRCLYYYYFFKEEAAILHANWRVPSFPAYNSYLAKPGGSFACFSQLRFGSKKLDDEPTGFVREPRQAFEVTPVLLPLSPAMYPMHIAQHYYIGQAPSFLCMRRIKWGKILPDNNIVIQESNLDLMPVASLKEKSWPNDPHLQPPFSAENPTSAPSNCGLTGIIHPVPRSRWWYSRCSSSLGTSWSHVGSSSMTRTRRLVDRSFKSPNKHQDPHRWTFVFFE